MTILSITEYILKQLDVLTIINSVALILLAISWFKDHYTILDNETFTTIATKYNEAVEAEEDNCGGGVGFHLYDTAETEEEE